MAYDAPLAYYAGGPDLQQTVLNALENAGRAVDRIDSDDLAQLDEFHALGRPATLALAELATIAEGDRVLDVGAGIGGPSRTLARHFGAHVTGVEPTERFARLNRTLTERSGLGDRVTVVLGDARELPFDDESFDVAWSQAVWQNIEDKAQVAREIHRVLKPGGRFALFEVGSGPGGDLHYPVPWANRPEESFLIRLSELRELLGEAGFAEQAWREMADIGPAIQEAAGGPGAARGVEGVNLAVVMPDLEERMASLARNIAEQRIEMVQAVVTKPG